MFRPISDHPQVHNRFIKQRGRKFHYSRPYNSIKSIKN